MGEGLEGFDEAEPCPIAIGHILCRMRAKYEGHSATGVVLSGILGRPYVDQEGGVVGSQVVVFFGSETEGSGICDLARRIEDGIVTRTGIICHLQCSELYVGVLGEVEVGDICEGEAIEIEFDISLM